MRVGRRFVRFWIYLFLACGTGCAGCGDCFDCGGGGCGNSGAGCNLDFGDSGCFIFCGGDGSSSCAYGECDSGTFAAPALVTGLSAPQGVVSDGIEVFYVDNGVLTQIDPDGNSPLVLATGVDASGGLKTDGLRVFWSGGWSGNADGGVDAGDAGDGVGDAGDDAGSDAGSVAISSNPGIYAVLVNGGDVEQITSLPTLPTFDLNELNAYARVPLNDAGNSTIGAIALSGDGGFAPFANVSGNTENLHAFVLRSDDLVSLDGNDIVSVPLDGGGASLLASGAGSLGLYETTAGVVTVSSNAPYSDFDIVGADAGAKYLGAVGAVATFGNLVYFVYPIGLGIYAFDLSKPSTPATKVAAVSGAVLYLAADANDVYWMTAGPSGALYAAPAR